jgi:hypothetical protein
VPRHVVRRSSLHLRGVRKLDLTAIPPVGANPPPAVSSPHEQYLDHRFSFVAWLLRPKPRLVTTRTVSRAAAVTSVPHLPSQTSDFHLPVFSFSRITTTEDWVVSNETPELLCQSTATTMDTTTLGVGATDRPHFTSELSR